MMNQNFFRKGTAVLLVLLGMILPLQAAEKPELLVKAWQEYQFLSLEAAESYFRQALKTDLDAGFVLEAKVGLGMINQFRERGEDLDQAEAYYQEVLTADPSTEVRALVESNLADLYLSRGNREEGLALLEKLSREHGDTVIGQDAQLRWMVHAMGEFGSEESLQMAEIMSELIEQVKPQASLERPLLLPLLANRVGQIYYWTGAYGQALPYLEIFSTYGNAANTSYGTQSGNLYRMAKIYEDKLDQPQPAGAMYRRVVMEYPNSEFSFYALEKAVALGALTREEVEKLNMNGVSGEILDELFANQGKGEED